MKHLDNIVGPVKRNTRLSMSAILDTKRFQFNYLTKEYFESFRVNSERLSQQFGVDDNDYVQWLDTNGLVHNMSNLHRYMIEKWPPDGAQTAIQLK